MAARKLLDEDDGWPVGLFSPSEWSLGTHLFLVALDALESDEFSHGSSALLNRAAFLEQVIVDIVDWYVV